MSDIIRVEDVSKAFPLPEGKGQFVVLDGVELAVAEGEVLALLGRSGSGKSTLLRIMAGLIPATSGQVLSSGKRVHGPNRDVAMVFQSFALLPWLSVVENVELGLEALGVSRSKRRALALQAIDSVGLDGFESAFPKELSGGMKQRVGFARALVINPRVLFLDEPFSALDVLTAENLRGEIDALWNAGTFPAKSVLIVTHNIEEAVFLADRVVVLGSNPGTIRGIVHIAMPRPHDRNGETFKRLTEYLYAVMTNPQLPVDSIGMPITIRPTRKATSHSPLSVPLPHVRVGTIGGFIELLADIGDGEEVARFADRLALSVDDFLSILDAASRLGFASVDAGRVNITPAGREFRAATILESKNVFRRQALEHVPLITAITRTLEEKVNKTMRSDFFIDLLDEYFPEEEARRQFETAVDWGRYAELFSFNAADERLVLEHDAASDARDVPRTSASV